MCVSLQRERNCSYYDCFKSAEREKLQLPRPLQVCRERETAATTTASGVQRERNCSYYDRFKSAEREREKLQLLRPLQVRREREREKLQLLRPLQVCREREREKNCSHYDTTVLLLYYCDTVLLYYDDRPPLNSQSPLAGASNQSRGGGLLTGSQH